MTKRPAPTLTAAGSGKEAMSHLNGSASDDNIRLTRRELEILALIVEGHSSKHVADLLFVSKRTIDFHLDNIYQKLEVNNRMQALQRAARLGLLSVSS